MFTSLNRWVGFPNRVYVDSLFSLNQLLQLYNGKRPCFMSVNRYTSKSEALMDRVVFDFDSKENWRLPYKDTKKLVLFAQKHSLPHKTICSGGKGFHFYFLIEEEPVTEESTNLLYSTQYTLNKNLKLETADEPLFAKRNLMIRIPQSIYVSLNRATKTYQQNGNYCRYLSDNDFLEGLMHIKKCIKEKGQQPRHIKNPPKLQELISYLPNFQYIEKTNNSLDFDLEQGGTLAPTLSAIGVPCLQHFASQLNPSHEHRIELTVWLKFQGYTTKAITLFYKNLQWKNYNEKETYHNASSIKPRLPSCKILKDEWCSSCPLK